MISKVLLQSIIERYYLDGLVERVKWVVKDDELVVKFINDTKDTSGEISYNLFPFKNSTLAIYNTSQLLKLINATQGLIHLHTDDSKLYIADETFDISYSLAEEFLIPKTPKITLPKEYAAKVEINDSSVLLNLIKAKKSIDNSDNVMINFFEDELNDLKKIEFVFGENNQDANKISYYLKGEIKEIFPTLLFNSDTFKNIIFNNKNMSEGVIYIYKEGLIKLEFNTETSIKSIYYLISKEVN